MALLFLIRIGNRKMAITASASIMSGSTFQMMQRSPNRYGRTMVWPTKGTLGTSIRCFMPGTMT